MSHLGLRLVVVFGAVALIALSVLDVLFLLFVQRQSVRDGRVHMELASVRAGQQLLDGKTLSDLRGDGLTFTVIGHDGERHSSEPVDLPPRLDGTTVVHAGYEHAVLALQGHPTLTWVVVSQPLQHALDHTFRVHQSALWVFLATGAGMVMLSLLFLRRTVLAPLQRLTELVGRSDTESLRQLGTAQRDDFSNLGRAIIAMNQKIGDDRQRMVAQLHDLTEAHDALASTQNQLVRAERLAVVGQLAAGLAHEVGNPLAIIRGFLDMLMPSAADADTKKALSRMSTELDRIQVTVRDLLDFSRAPQTAVGVGDARAALLHLEGLLRPQDRIRGLSLEISVPQELASVAITTDALTQVLLNLTLNAADVLNGTGTLRVVADESDTEVSITVEDSGPGVPEDQRSKIFEPFFTTKQAGQGTGLGLSVCERIVTSAGGELTVDQGPLGGARFKVRVPRAAAQ